jgi:hypothetical protein
MHFSPQVGDELTLGYTVTNGMAIFLVISPLKCPDLCVLVIEWYYNLYGLILWNPALHHVDVHELLTCWHST